MDDAAVERIVKALRADRRAAEGNAWGHVEWYREGDAFVEEGGGEEVMSYKETFGETELRARIRRSPRAFALLAGTERE